MRSFATVITLACALLAAGPAYAEIEKLAWICDKGICPHWWPKVNPPPGWAHDRQHSYLYNLNALVPEGQSFANTETVMYANAIYKPGVPESPTLAAFIEGDHASFKEKTPDLAIKIDGTLRTKDGTPAKTWRMQPKSDGQWERVAYFEEDEYYMVFVISSRTSKGHSQNMPCFEALVANYAR